MGTKERKQREKEELKGQILAAAREIFFEKGYEETSIRNIADRIEYSPGTIYLHFKDKDSIFYEIKQEGFRIMGQQMMVLQNVSDPFERLKAVGRVYLNFAAQYPDYYDLMFVIRAPMNVLEDGECWEEGANAFGFLVSVVQDCVNSGRFKGHDVEELSFVFWSALHGMVTLAIRGRCIVISESKRENIVNIGMELFSDLLSKC